MSTRQSACAALVMALGFGISNVGCANDETSTSQQSTVLRVTGTSSVDIGWAEGHVVAAESSSSSSGGGSFFSASLASGGHFSGDVGGASSFSGSMGGSSSFDASVAPGGTFSGSSIPGCSLTGLCDFAVAFCAIFAEDESDCTHADAATCYAEVSTSEFRDVLDAALDGSGVTEDFFCALIDYLGCLANSGSLENLSDTVANQCANDSGLSDLLQDSSSATQQ